MDTVGDARTSRDELVGAAVTSRRTRTLVGLVLLLLVVGIAVDRQQVARERAALVAAVDAGEGVVTASQTSLRHLAQYAGSLLIRTEVPAASRRSARALVGQDAARWEQRLRQERADVLAQRVLPWHADLRTARDAYADRLGTWADELAEVRADPQRLLDGGDDVRQSRSRAVQALLDAGVEPARARELLGRGEAGPGARR